jgi:hypothetical protein
MSLINQMYGAMVINAPKPEIGQGATTLGYSDRHAASVVEVLKGGELIAVQRDHAKVVKGSAHDGSAEYEYEPNPDGPIYWFRRGKDGRWEHVYKNPESGRWKKSGGNGLILGMRREYYDPHF